MISVRVPSTPGHGSAVQCSAAHLSAGANSSVCIRTMYYLTSGANGNTVYLNLGV